MAQHIWIVSSGSYSDYSVSCVCPDHNTAKKVAEALNTLHGPRHHGDEFDVEKMPWVESVADLEGTTTVYRVFIDQGGAETKREEYQMPRWQVPDQAEIWEPWGTHVAAESQRGYDVALKAARDRLAQLKAEAELDSPS